MVKNPLVQFSTFKIPQKVSYNPDKDLFKMMSCGVLLDADQVKKAYHAMLKNFHPDKFTSTEKMFIKEGREDEMASIKKDFQVKTSELNEAYKKLKDEDFLNGYLLARRQYLFAIKMDQEKVWKWYGVPQLEDWKSDPEKLKYEAIQAFYNGDYYDHFVITRDFLKQKPNSQIESEMVDKLLWLLGHLTFWRQNKYASLFKEFLEGLNLSEKQAEIKNQILEVLDKNPEMLMPRTKDFYNEIVIKLSDQDLQDEGQEAFERKDFKRFLQCQIELFRRNPKPVIQQKLFEGFLAVGSFYALALKTDLATFFLAKARYYAVDQKEIEKVDGLLEDVETLRS